MKRTPAHALLRTFSVTTAMCLMIAMFINAIVDPYGYLGSPTIRGITTHKPFAFLHDRYFKTGLARRTAADCLLAGSSRIGEGIPPDHPAFANCKRVLDVSLAGPNLTELIGVVRTAQETSSSPTLLLSLDFFSFNATRNPTRGGDETLFQNSKAARLHTTLSLLLSTDTLIDSVLTPFHQRDLNFYQPDGTVSQTFLESTEHSRPTRITFLRGIRGYIGHHLPSPGHDFRLSTASRAPITELQQFLAAQQQKGTRVALFFSPAHAWQWELVSALGLWDTWEQWKRAVVTANELAASSAGHSAYPVWDFTSYDGPAVEPVPQDSGAFTPLQYYWDSSHFKRTVGAMIVDRIMTNEGASAFGELRTSANISIALEENRALREQWLTGHANDRRDILAIVDCYAPATVLTRISRHKLRTSVCQRLTAETR